MTSQALLASVAFAVVLLVTAFSLTHLTEAALLGAAVVVVTGVVTMGQAVDSVGAAQGTLTLLFGMMVVVRALESTGVFAVLAHRLLVLARGEGRRLLLALVGLATLIGAWLPNATTVLLLGPLLPPLARELGLDPRPLLILLVLTANSSGLLTVIGDPATYIVANGIDVGFGRYLMDIAGGGLLVLAAILPTLPWLYRDIWRARFSPHTAPPPQLHHRPTLVLLLMLLAAMLGLFIGGDLLPVPLTPDVVALLGASVSLTIVRIGRLLPVERLLADLDWSTLIYFMAVFVLIGSLERTGVLAAVALGLADLVGKDLFLSSLLLLVATALLSAVVPNIPLLAALTPLLLETCEQQGFAAPPIPLFAALMLGGTLGGNATLIGASANLVAAGIARHEGVAISFRGWLRTSLPTVALQLAAAVLWLRLKA